MNSANKNIFLAATYTIVLVSHLKAWLFLIDYVFDAIIGDQNNWRSFGRYSISWVIITDDSIDVVYFKRISWV